jgi:hypothetical protein
LSACIEGQFFTFAVLIASMLLDVEHIANLILKDPELFSAWESALQSTKKPIYIQLVEKFKKG